MIHYHGSPCTPLSVAVALYTRRHAMVSFAHPDQVALIAEVAQSFTLDNGAYSMWKAGKGDVDIVAYHEWCSTWMQHPGFDWLIIPDKIDGTAGDNDALIERWLTISAAPFVVPVYHLHESVSRLSALMSGFPRIALGSSGEFSQPGSDRWWDRMHEVMGIACDEQGRPRVKLHGLRMLSPTIFSHVPLASADSTNVAQNSGLDKRWTGPYQPRTPATRALVLAERIELHAAASVWSRHRGIQQSFALLG